MLGTSVQLTPLFIVLYKPSLVPAKIVEPITANDPTNVVKPVFERDQVKPLSEDLYTPELVPTKISIPFLIKFKLLEPPGIPRLE